MIYYYLWAYYHTQRAICKVVHRKNVGMRRPNVVSDTTHPISIAWDLLEPRAFYHTYYALSALPCHKTCSFLIVIMIISFQELEKNSRKIDTPCSPSPQSSILHPRFIVHLPPRFSQILAFCALALLLVPLKLENVPIFTILGFSDSRDDFLP